MPSVLITQCLQRDFVAPIARESQLPNALHVGYDESLRLLGHDPEASPVAQVLAWARATPEVVVLHVRDWHDPADPKQEAHLDTFGAHCVAGSEGAELVVGEADEASFVNATGLNDLYDTDLGERLSALASDGPLRIGVIGVWTEAKVSFLLYDLKTRLGIDALATCSALTASSSRARHHAALDHLQRVLGVYVTHSVADFVAWLSPGAALAPLPSPPSGLPMEGASLPDDHRRIAGHLYRDTARIALHTLAGGFSGAGVYRVEAWDDDGHRLADTVLKLGPTSMIGHERAAMERVAEVLGSAVPSVRGYVDLGATAGLKLAWAGHGVGTVQTLARRYRDGADPVEIADVLRTTFRELLAPFFAAAEVDRLPPLTYYLFKQFRDVRPAVNAVWGVEAGDWLDFPGGRRVENVARFYELYVDYLPDPQGELHRVCWVHGDLNLANILVDGRGNVWLIDFARARRGHFLQDFAKLENDLCYIFTPLQTEEDLEAACTVTDALVLVEDLAAPLPACPVGHPMLVRLWADISSVRRELSAVAESDRDPLPLAAAMLRYAVHTLSFDEPSDLGRRWALYAACRWAEVVRDELRSRAVLRVDHVGGDGLLGLTICPGRVDRGRNLATDLASLVAAGCRHLVSLMTERERVAYGVASLVDAAQAAGMQVHVFPIEDQGVPSAEAVRPLVARISGWIDLGEPVVLHCLGGLGRSGLVAALVLMERGLPADRALREVRAARGSRAVETAGQEAFVRSWEVV